jgi:hypothetical protein
VWRAIVWWLAGPLPILVVIVLMLWAPRVKRHWLKILLRIGGGLSASFLVGVLGLGLLFSSGDPKPQYQATIPRVGCIGRLSCIRLVFSAGTFPR